MRKLTFATLAFAASAVLGLTGFVQAQPATAPSAPAATPAKPATPHTTPMAAPAKPAATTPAEHLIDINSASKEELDKLPGIGSARAEAIIKARPYKGKDDLTHKKVIPDNVYAGIKDKIIARQK